MTSLTLDNSTIPVSEAKKDRECERESGWKKVEEKITTSVSFTLPFLLWSVSAMLWKLCAMYVNESYRDIFFEWNGATAKKRHIMHKQYINSHSSIERERARLPLRVYRRIEKKKCFVWQILRCCRSINLNDGTLQPQQSKCSSLSHTHTHFMLLYGNSTHKNTLTTDKELPKNLALVYFVATCYRTYCCSLLLFICVYLNSKLVSWCIHCGNMSFNSLYWLLTAEYVNQ